MEVEEDAAPVVERRSSGGAPSAAWSAKRAELLAAKRRIASETGASAGDAPGTGSLLAVTTATPVSTPSQRAKEAPVGGPQVIHFSAADFKAAQSAARAREEAAEEARVTAAAASALRAAVQARRKTVGGVAAAPPTRSASVVRAGRSALADQSPLTERGPRPRPTPLPPPRAPRRAAAAPAARRVQPQAAPSRPSTASAGRPHSSSSSSSRAAPQRPRRVSMPSSATDPVTRTNFDKRTCRRQHAAPFAAAIARHRASLPAPVLPQGKPAAATTAVYVRKRPLFAAEAARGEFDVVTVAGGSSLLVHVAAMKPDLRRMFLKTLRCGWATCFCENATDEAVFEATAAPLIAAAANNRPAALFMFGQTGSGKTHTSGALERRIAHVLLGDGGAGVRCSFFEILGKHAVDLLSEGRTEVTLRELPPSKGCAIGAMELQGALELHARTADELLAAISAGKARRAVSATSANAASSRSHAVLRLSLPGGGSLTLVDCAGSERNEDSGHHDAAQRVTGAAINASLYALKECIRARAKAAAKAGATLGAHTHVPYRATLLTRVLAECLTRRDAQLAVIGTLSPAAADTEHSVGTLQGLAVLAGCEEGHAFTECLEDVPEGLYIDPLGAVRCRQPDRKVPPVQWRPADLRAWLSAAKQGAFAAAAAAAPQWLAGRDVARMSKAGVTSVLAQGDAKLGAALYEAFREEVAAASSFRASK